MKKIAKKFVFSKKGCIFVLLKFNMFNLNNSLNMKKISIFGLIGAIAGAVAFNINAGLSNNAMSDTVLANIEALARNESGENKEALYDCGPGCVCCGPGNVRTCSEGERCK